MEDGWGLFDAVELIDLGYSLAAFNLYLIQPGDGYHIADLVVGALSDEDLAAFGQFLQAFGEGYSIADGRIIFA